MDSRPTHRTGAAPLGSQALPAWRIVLGLLGTAAYLALSHWLMLNAADAPWAVLALLGPLLLTAAGYAAGRRHLPTLVATLLGLAGLVALVAAGGLGAVERLYLAQHAGIHAALGAACVASMRRPGRLSWIGLAAERVHGRLTPSMVAYTHRLTGLWAGYFLGMALLSCVVYAALPWSAWSLLANVVTPSAIAALFVGEHWLRYRLHPEFERAGIMDSLRAWQRRPDSAVEP